MGLAKCLTWNDRLLIEKYLRQGVSARTIAERIHVCQSTIYNEIRRGRYERLNGQTWETVVAYSPDLAQARYDDLKRNHGADLKIGNDLRLANYIEQKIVQDHYSPAAVLAEIKRSNLKFSVTICEKTIYNYIEKGVFLNLTNADLPAKGRYKKRQYKKVRAARTSAGTSIEERPDSIRSRIEFGHWEMDTVIGKKRTKPTLLVLTERKTRYEIIMKMPDKTARSVVECLDRLERRYGKRFSRIFRTITCDNGTEFANQIGMELSVWGKRNRTKVYYCHPYSAYERGSNENQNRLIRRFLPKGTDFRREPPGYIRAVETWINNLPREVLKFKSSGELFQQELELIE